MRNDVQLCGNFYLTSHICNGNMKTCTRRVSNNKQNFKDRDQRYLMVDGYGGSYKGERQAAGG